MRSLHTISSGWGNAVEVHSVADVFGRRSAPNAVFRGQTIELPSDIVAMAKIANAAARKDLGDRHEKEHSKYENKRAERKIAVYALLANPRGVR